MLGPGINARPDPATPSEDRGTSVWVWYRVGYGRFVPFDEAEKVVELSVPIGWRLVPDASEGVVLSDVFGHRIGAGPAYMRACLGTVGFKVRSVVDLGPVLGHTSSVENSDCC